MRIRLFIMLLFILAYQMGFSQVRGINYTLTPDVEYVLWHKKAGLENGPLLGGKFGFGFGEILELRGTYHQGYNIKTGFSEYGIQNFADSLFTPSDVKLVRYGGEIKLNIGRSSFLPFVSISTGVQSISRDTLMPNKQIYAGIGAGFQVSIKDRFTFALYGKNTAYRYNSGVHLLEPGDKLAMGVTNADFGTEDLTNWSFGASLQIYLSGKRDKNMSDIDKAFYESFSGGFKSLGWTIEPSVGKLNFSNAMPYRDAWMAGGSAGIDIGPYIGLRGFYWNSIENGTTTKLDDLAIYGGELKMNLNSGNGIIPFVTFGGGNIDVQDTYTGRTDTSNTVLTTEDRGFAMGGAGITIPFSRGFRVFGNARAMLSTDSNTDDFDNPSQIQTSWFYSAGIKLTIGKRHTNPNDLIEASIQDAVALERAIKDEEIRTLDRQLKQAVAAEDYAKAELLKREVAKAELEKEMITVENKGKEIQTTVINEQTPVVGTTANPTPAYQAPVVGQNQGQLQIIPSNSQIRMSPAEFENLIEEVLESTLVGPDMMYQMPYQQYGGNQYGGNQMYPMPQQQMGSSNMDNRVGAIEAQLNEINARQDSLEQFINNDMNALSKQIDVSLGQLNNKIDNLDRNNRKNKSETTGEKREESDGILDAFKKKRKKKKKKNKE